MFGLIRRLFWFGTGAGLGFGGAMWVRSRVRRAVRRYVPERLPEVSAEVADGARKVGERVGQNVRQLGGEMREAVTDGRETMRAREAELRQELIVPRRSARQRARAPSARKELGGGKYPQ